MAGGWGGGGGGRKLRARLCTPVPEISPEENSVAADCAKVSVLDEILDRGPQCVPYECKKVAYARERSMSELDTPK